jgi:hypothetical protein
MAKRDSVLNPGWGKRLRTARAEYEKAHDVRLTWEEIAKMVTDAGARVTYQAVQQYFKGREPKRFKTVIALATALEESPGWLAFEEGRSRHDLRPLPVIERQREEVGPPTAPSRRRRES